MYNKFVEFEISVLDSLDAVRNELMDCVNLFLSSLADRGLIWILAGVILLFFSKTRKIGFCVLLALLVNFILVNLAVKPLVARVRPYDINTSVRIILDAPHDFSFPSGHTSASFAAAVAILLKNRRWGVAAVVLATLIGFSRLYLYVHFPTDVICGALFGIISALTASYAVSKFTAVLR